MTSFVQVNFFTTTISAALTTSDTSLSLGSTTGAPTIPSGSNWPLVLTANGVYEIVYVTALNGSTATVSRGEESSVAQAWATGTTIFGAFTANSVLYDGQTIPFTAITGQIADAQVPESAVTQYQADLAIDGTQVSGSMDLAGTLTIGGATTLNSTIQIGPPAGGTAVNILGVANTNNVVIAQGDTGIDTGSGLLISRYGSTANSYAVGPNLLLHDASENTASVLQQSGGQTELWTYVAGTTNQLAFWNTNRGLTLNAATSGNTLTVNGTAYATILNSSSDARLKTDVETISDARTRVSRIRGVFFRWKSTGTPSAGVLAQEVRDVFPEAVREQKDGMLSVDPLALIGLLFAALGEEFAE